MNMNRGDGGTNGKSGKACGLAGTHSRFFASIRGRT
jgi:hypothetical protein